VKIENKKFNAVGNPGILKLLLGLFKEMIVKIENYYNLKERTELYQSSNKRY
jgi:hypothetical protein